MKVQILLPISIAVSVGSFALMKIRVKELVAEEKRDSFLAVKLGVTEDVLTEYRKEKQGIESRMEKEKSLQEELQKAITELSTGSKKGDLDACAGLKKAATDEIGTLQEQIKTFQDESPKEKAAWEAEIATLKEKVNAPSPICNYLKAGSSVQGLCPEKKEEPKAEPQEKNEPPKEEEKQAEPPKQEAPQQEAPKEEAPQQEAPKPEEPKPEAPK